MVHLQAYLDVAMIIQSQKWISLQLVIVEDHLISRLLMDSGSEVSDLWGSSSKLQWLASL